MDKLKRLSNLNDKSSDLQLSKCFCGNTPEHELEIKKYIKEKNLVSNKKSIASSKVLIKELPNNPYCSSITGKYAFDLSQISNFNVYFWKSTDNPSLNPAIEYWLTDLPSSAVDWELNQKIQCKKTLDIFTTFTGTTSTVVNNYNECDAVCVLAPLSFLIFCYGPYYIKNEPIFVDNKIVYFISSQYLIDNINEGTFMYNVMITAWGLGFGLALPYNNIADSTIMPGVVENEPLNYKGIGGYIQNNAFNTIMTSNREFFLPSSIFDLTGYPETIMPLDALALRWLYNIGQVPTSYINTYGVQLITDTKKSKMIVGKNQIIEFSSDCIDIAFYLSNQYMTFNNLNYLRFEYIRNIETKSSFYTKDIDATVSVLNLNNQSSSYIFIENRSLKTNLTINLNKEYIKTQILNLYIMDSYLKYSISGKSIIVIRHKRSGKTITINTFGVETIIMFDEKTIKYNEKDKKIINKKEVNKIKSKSSIIDIYNNYLKMNKSSKEQKVNQIKSITPNKIIIKELPHNPYCLSITTPFALDLSKISNFNIYFWTSTDNINLNNAIKIELTNPVVSAVDWEINQKTQCKKAFDIFTTFTGTTSTIINNYSDSDIVCVLYPTDTATAGTYLFMLKNAPEFFDNKLILFASSTVMNSENIKEGGEIYYEMIRSFGLFFGLIDIDFEFDDFYELNNKMPAYGKITNTLGYFTLAGYIQNNICNTVMSDNDGDFFLPINRNYNTNSIGYTQSLMPLDAIALRWLYEIEEIPEEYINTYGVHTINPSSDKLGQIAMIAGKNQTITFGSNNNSINFYLTNKWFSYDNLQPIKIEYNRPIEKPYGFYPGDLDSTISIINLDNTGEAFIFLENRALIIDLTVNILNNSGQVLNFYCMDCKQNYSIRGNVYRNLDTNITFTINNPVGATVNVYFDK